VEGEERKIATMLNSFLEGKSKLGGGVKKKTPVRKGKKRGTEVLPLWRGTVMKYTNKNYKIRLEEKKNGMCKDWNR